MITTAARRVFIENIREIGSGEVLLKGWIYRLRVLGKTAFVISAGLQRRGAVRHRVAGSQGPPAQSGRRR